MYRAIGMRTRTAVSKINTSNSLLLSLATVSTMHLQGDIIDAPIELCHRMIFFKPSTPCLAHLYSYVRVMPQLENGSSHGLHVARFHQQSGDPMLNIRFRAG